MASTFKRFGFWIIMLLAIVLVGVGIWLVNQLINNIWVVPLDSPDFRIVQRAVANGTADATIIMQAADSSMIAIFLGCMVSIGMGLALPIVFLVNRRLELTRRRRMPSLLVVLRQGFWAGLWLGFCMWLQMGRTFGLPVALLLAVVFILFEVLFNIRSQSISLSAAD